MKIVFVQAGLGAGGTEKIVNLLAQYRADLGDEVHVLTFAGRIGGSYFPYQKSVNVETMEQDEGSTDRTVQKFIKRIRWLRLRLAALRPELVISFLTKVNVVAIIAGFGLKIPILISERNNPNRQSANPIWLPASLFFANFAAGLVMQTEAARANLPGRLQRKSAVIPNPSTLPSDATRSAGSGNRVVAVGRLDRQKGFDLLLDAFARVAPDCPEARLTIFGEGPERSALQAQALSLGIGDRLTMPGVTRTPAKWLQAGEVFVLSSRFEGFPNVLLEALAGGLAIVAFDCPWGPSTILTNEEDGILVPPEDVQGLSLALKRLLTQRQLRRAFAKAAPKTARRFATPSILAQWDAVIAKVVGVRALPTDQFLGDS